MYSSCDCRQSQVLTRERFKIYLHFNYYEVEGIGKRKTAEEIKSDKERHLQKLCGLRARGTEKLKDDRSEGIDVNLMHSDTPLFTFFLRNFYE